jgi:uncharacterized protein YggE
MPRPRDLPLEPEVVEVEAPFEPHLAVRGEHTREVDPEIAYLIVEVTSRAPTKEEALSQLTDRTEWLRSTLDRFASDIDRVDTAVFRVNPIFDKGSMELPTGYVGSIRTKVTVGDLSRIGDLVSHLSLGHMSEVTSLQWALRESSPVHSEIRIAAVREAVRRARDYAAALGSVLTGLIEIRDVGMRGYEPFPLRRSTDRHPEVFDFEPEVQRVSVQVEARFTMTPPMLG